MIVKEFVGVAVAVLGLAGLSIAIVNGGNTAQIMKAAGDSFSTVVRAATLRG